MILKIVCVSILMTVRIEDFDINNIFINEKSYKNILVYNFSYKTLIGAKPLPIRFDKISGFVRVYNETIIQN